MTSPETTADTVRAYHEARCRADIATAAAQLAEDFSFRSPLIESTDRTGHLAGIEQLVAITRHVELLEEFFAGDSAVLIYDLHTATPVGIQRTAKHFRLRDGRITEIALIFDATGWHEIMRSAGVLS
ncbi:nuclear transport factor 2 family protein [Nocardia stercoris]|uniref:Nuclear transport factor 2 family protein n=1 Tax=Nocardia stercoris TaxID=2483361 RepID=A0A3M2LHT4_9NOCA|nr:nuclear transport factor 2 family protein [Nocardia stercoris]RMI34318.1 nuclear transport factor 2 family protein [Nocardia stercoris]